MTPNDMPWKDPHNWLHAEIMAPLLSFLLAFLRTIYQGDIFSWRRRLLESTICGLITLTAAYGIEAMQFHHDWKYAVAGTIGFLGVEYIRSLAHKFLSKKVGEK